MRTIRTRTASVNSLLTCLVLTVALTAAGLIIATAAEYGSITGTVVDQKTHMPVPFALVEIDGTHLMAVTDSLGAFTLVNVPPGTYSVRVSHAGHRTVMVDSVTVFADQANRLAFVLRETTAEGDTEVVTVDQVAALPVPTVDGNLSLDMGSVNPGDRLDALLDRSADVRASIQHRDKAAREYAGALRYRTAYSTSASYMPRINFVNPNWNTEEYAHITENEFLEVTQKPLSTFSIDVDAASYANVRRFINLGRLPPPDAVRIEEMINYFRYDYPQPTDEHPFSITAEMSVCPWNPEHHLVHIGLQGRELPTDDLPPSNLVFLIDVSGSMQPPNKLPLLKSAFRLLIDHLRRQDRVAMVVYAGAAGMVLPSTSGSRKGEIFAALDRLQAGGTTAGAAGIRLAYETAEKHFIRGGNNRVILATDGDFNVGVSSTSELVRMIEKKREAGVFLTVLGFGEGNLKDGRMEQLADKGNGNYAYIDNIREARKVLVNEMGGTLFTIAKDVKIQVEFNPVHIQAYRLVGYENRLLQKEDFNDDTKDAGELGSGHTVTALYEVVPAGAEFVPRSVDSLKYQTPGIKPEARESSEALTVKFRYKEPDGSRSKLIVQTVSRNLRGREASSDNFRFSAAVAEFGMLLRDSKFKEDASYDQALALALGALGADPNGYRHEFVSLVETCRLLENPRAER
jgi:Ca-activated chloride channel family protein